MIQRIIILCIVLTVFAVNLTAQNNTQINVLNAAGEVVYTYLEDTPDPDIKQLPREIANLRQRDDTNLFINKLAEYINENSNSDYERIKKAHDWVALNIRYDAASYFSRRIPSQDYRSVIRRGLAVCAGYSDVFQILCDALKIECKTISGYARGIGSNIFYNEDPMDTNHAWNIVTIDGNKYIIDSTWDSGHINGQNFRANYITDYLFINPENFIYKHFPYNKADQLLEPPVDSESFMELPFLRPKFFKVMETYPNLKKITNLSQGEPFSMEFTVIPGYELIYGWYTQSGAKVGNDIFPGRKDSYQITTSRLRPGRYTLRLWVQKQGSKGYLSCGEYGFIIK